MTYQDTNTMIDLLKKAHEVQIKVAELNDGHSIHVELHSHDNIPKDGYHMSLDVILFYSHNVDGYWTFNAIASYDELMHVYEDMMFHINRL